MDIPALDLISDEDLRRNYQFVLEFESLRKRHGYREMSDAALLEIASSTTVPYATLRIWRSLRNAIAHADRVNRSELETQLLSLRTAADPSQAGTPLVNTQATRQAQPYAAPPMSQAAREQVRAFRIHAWTDNRLEQEMLANGFISMGGEEISDLTTVSDPEVIRTQLTSSLPTRTPRAIALFVGYWKRFLWEAQPGDLIVLPLRDRSVALGELTGPYHYASREEARARHRRNVSWNTFVRRDTLSAELITVINAQHTILEFKKASAVNVLETMVGAP